MGVQNKLLAPLGGEAMLTHTLRSVAAVGLDDVVVVTGHEANDVNDVLQNQPVRVVHNANYAQGPVHRWRPGCAPGTMSKRWLFALVTCRG